MNLGTKIRTAMLVAVLLLALLSIFDVFFTTIIGKIVVSILLIAGTFVVYWHNNDWTEAACIGTGVTRQRKREEKEDYIGDFFYQKDDEDEIIDDRDIYE